MKKVSLYENMIKKIIKIIKKIFFPNLEHEKDIYYERLLKTIEEKNRMLNSQIKEMIESNNLEIKQMIDNFVKTYDKP